MIERDIYLIERDARFVGPFQYIQFEQVEIERALE